MRDPTGYQAGARQARVYWWTSADGYGHVTVDHDEGMGCRLRLAALGRAVNTVSELDYMFKLSTGLLLNATSGMTEEHAAQRVGGNLNSIVFVTAHLVDVRHYLAREVGIQHANPVATFLDQARGIADVVALPSLAELRAAWIDVSAAVASGVGSFGSLPLERELTAALPFGARTLASGLAFLLQHEMYHTGQIALLRRHFGYPAMTWSDPAA